PSLRPSRRGVTGWPNGIRTSTAPVAATVPSRTVIMSTTCTGRTGTPRTTDTMTSTPIPRPTLGPATPRIKNRLPDDVPDPPPPDSAAGRRECRPPGGAGVQLRPGTAYPPPGGR